MADPLTLAFIIVTVISSVLSMVLKPKSNMPKLLPGEIDNVPTAEQGSKKPVLFGRGYFRQPNVVYWGHVHAEPITVSSGGKSGS